MDRTQKADTVKRLQSSIAAAPFLVVTDYKGLDVEEMTNLRAELRKENATFEVVKNTLMKLAFEGTNKTVLNDDFAGPTAVAYGEVSSAAFAKVLVQFRKSTEKLEIKAGFIDGKRLNEQQVEYIGDLPDMDTLRSMFLSALTGVPRNFVSLCAAAPRGFVGILSARKKQLEDAA